MGAALNDPETPGGDPMSGPMSREGALEATLRAAIEHPASGVISAPPKLKEALLHAVFPGGARVRPGLCLAVTRAAGGSADEVAVGAAAAVELIHCASLVHDDLPCFDDADVRRGLPTVHKVWGEAMAVLVGDALIALAFDVLARALSERPDLGARPIARLAAATGGHGGLVGGQAWELEDPHDIDVSAYHRAKTAALFEAAAELGALVAGAAPAPFAELGRSLGMTYQLADDVCDRIGSASALGKATGRDAALGRPTGAAGDLALAEARLRLAMKRTAVAVPSCPGELELRATVESVLDRLAARCRIGRRGAVDLGYAAANRADTRRADPSRPEPESPDSP